MYQIGKVEKGVNMNKDNIPPTFLIRQSSCRKKSQGFSLEIAFCISKETD